MKALWVIRFLLVAAIGIDVYLLYHSLIRSTLAGCGEQEYCAQFLSTSCAYAFGVPVSLLALGPHTGLLFLSWRETRDGRPGPERFWLITFCCLIFFAAIWFISIQAFVLGGFCRYCLTAHAAGIVSAIWLLARLVPVPKTMPDWAARCLAIVAFLALITSQLLFPASRVAVATVTGSSSTPSPVKGARLIKLSPRLDAIPLENLPVLGNRHGPLILVFFDFTCANCRRAHPLIEQAVGDNPNLGIVLIPLPINPRCNHYISNLVEEHRDACDYARMALALWHAHPKDFPAFSNEILGAEPPRSPSDITVWLEGRFGVEEWRRDLADPWVETQMQWDVEGFGEAVQRSGHVELPKFIIGPKIISGAPAVQTELQSWISGYLGGYQP